MITTRVRNAPFDSAHISHFGPSVIDDRTENSRLTALGAVFMTFDAAGLSDPTTLRYEEVIYVVSGAVTLTVIDAGAESTVVGDVGDVITLEKGSTVRYGATEGTRLFVCVAPRNWKEAAQ